MNRITRFIRYGVLALAIVFASAATQAQDFDFDKLNDRVRDVSVIIDIKFEVSFGIHSTEQQDRYLGTVVSEDGLVIFNGSALESESSVATLSGFTMKTTPTRIEVSTLDGTTYTGEYLGVDRYTKLGFIQITDLGDDKLKSISFVKDVEFTVGDWVALYMLLPEYIEPPLAADVGMVSTLVEQPEPFALTVGFNSLQLTSVLFNEDLEAVGVLGGLFDPGTGGDRGMMESFGSFAMPLLGVISAERLEKIIADPPKKGETDRGWLGITLQALTTDMAEFWELDVPGGIIVNEVVRNSPAEEAGLEVGDIIVAVNGQPVRVDRDENLTMFQRQIAEMGAGTSVEFTIVRRDGDELDTRQVLATLDKAPLAATDAPEFEVESLEFTVRDLVFGDYMRFNKDPESLSGVIVSEIKQGGLADIGGLRFGDVIQRIGSTGVSNLEEAQAAIEQVEQEEPSEVIFFVWRNNKTLFVNVKTDWE